MNQNQPNSASVSEKPAASPHPHEFTVIINNQPFRTSEHTLTGLQIKALAGLPGDYELFLIRGAESVPVTNDEKTHIHEGIEFRAIPAGTFGR